MYCTPVFTLQALNYSDKLILFSDSHHIAALNLSPLLTFLRQRFILQQCDTVSDKWWFWRFTKIQCYVGEFPVATAQVIFDQCIHIALANKSDSYWPLTGGVIHVAVDISWSDSLRGRQEEWFTLHWIVRIIHIAEWILVLASDSRPCSGQEQELFTLQSDHWFQLAIQVFAIVIQGVIHVSITVWQNAASNEWQ